MTRMTQLRPEFVEFIPAKPQPGVLYVSRKYKTATHLCCCGCGNKVVTPLNPSAWSFSAAGDKVSLHPSIGSWSLPCKSHYWIRGNRIQWAGGMSQRQIEIVQKSDQRAIEAHFDAPAPGLLAKLWAWLKSLAGR